MAQGALVCFLLSWERGIEAVAGTSMDERMFTSVLGLSEGVLFLMLFLKSRFMRLFEPSFSYLSLGRIIIINVI
jgi:hypothetical protein